MGLEKQLAEIQVLTREVVGRANSEVIRKNLADLPKYNDAIGGLFNDPLLLYQNYIHTKKALKNRDIVESSRSLTEFCMNSKNLADSLNIFLQMLYGEKKPELRKLASNISNAPRTRDRKTIYDIYISAHDHSPYSTSNLLRNMKAHGRGYSALRPFPDPNAGFFIALKDDYDPKSLCDAAGWLEGQMHSYFSMTQKVLETISESDQEVLIEKGKIRRDSVTLQRIKNWKKRNQTPVLIGLAGALIASGVMGTLTYQKVTEKDRITYEANEIRSLVSQAAATRKADFIYYFAAMDIEKKTFLKSLNNISNRTQNLGNSLDECLSRLKSFSLSKIDADLNKEYEDFNFRKERFYNSLSNTYVAVNSGKDILDNIQKVSDLLASERMLGEQEDRLVGKIDWRRVKMRPTSVIMIDSNACPLVP